MTKTSAEIVRSIYNALSTGPRSRYDVATSLNLKGTTVKNVLTQLVTVGAVSIAGKVTSGRRGRPATLYAQVPVSEARETIQDYVASTRSENA